MNIDNLLIDDEKIIYQNKAHTTKTDKQIWRILLMFFVIGLFWFLLYIEKDSTNNLTIAFIVILILTLFILYGVIYNFILDIKDKNNEYFVSNKRIFVYNKKNGFSFNYIDKITVISIAREKDIYGDLKFHFDLSLNNPISSIDNMLKNKDNVRIITFTGCENPRHLVYLISKMKNNIHIYDDHITIMGKKIRIK